MKPDMTFGGVCILLVGYLDQLPPVLGYSLWGTNILSDADSQGKLLLGLFASFFRLDYNYRINLEDPDTVFLQFFELVM